jgi:hypothetical protein
LTIFLFHFSLFANLQIRPHFAGPKLNNTESDGVDENPTIRKVRFRLFSLYMFTKSTHAYIYIYIYILREREALSFIYFTVMIAILRRN